jgi:hypothetical protein
MLDASRRRFDHSLADLLLSATDDPSKEGREEGNPILPYGLRRIGNWFVRCRPPPRTGKESLEETNRFAQAGPLSSICSVGTPSWRTETRMLKMAHSWSKGLRSSPLLLVRVLLTVIRRDFNTRPTEIELEEDRTCISLTIVDTPGFGDDIDNETR